ncbi:MAG: Lrp/AsnC family transcriptional regulator [Halobacteriaceae archaeon]
MVQGFVMVKTGAGRSEAVREELVGIEGVEEAHVVAGNFDIIVEVAGGEVYDILHAVVAEVQALDGVTDTKTYISLS